MKSFYMQSFGFTVCAMNTHYTPVAPLAGVVSVEGDGCLQVGEGEGAHQGTQAQVRRGEHRLGTRARDVRHGG